MSSAKNTLTDADADSVEARFQANLGLFEEGVDDAWPEKDNGGELSGQKEPHGRETSQITRAPADTLAANSIPVGLAPAEAASADAASGETSRRRLTAKTIRLRDKVHCKFVSRQPCLICGRKPTEPHHLRYAQPRALGRKVSDEYTVPVCRLHHRELRRLGDEAAWWARLNIDPLPIAISLWRQTRLGQPPNHECGR